MSNKVETLTDITLFSAVASNNDKIEAAFDNTLSRDGSGPNQMEANLDINGYRILNLPDAVSDTEPVTLGQAAEIAGVENPLTRESVGAVFYPQTASETTAAVTPTNYYFEPGDVRRYGAVGDGATDDAAALQDALDSGHDVSLRPEGATFIISTGLTWSRDNAAIHANNCTLSTNQNITALTVGELGAGNLQLNSRITGNLKVLQTGGTTTLPGIVFNQCYEGDYHVSAQGFSTGVKITTTGQGFVYNVVRFGRIYDNTTYGVWLAPASNGWVNENTFIGGRFAASAAVSNTILIYAPDSGSTYGNPNNNVWLHPSIESTGGADWAIVDGGISNQYIQPRMEGTWTNTIDLDPDGVASIEPSMWITVDALQTAIFTSWYANTVWDLGAQSQIWSSSRTKHVSRGNGDSLYGRSINQFVREWANVDSGPLMEVIDTYHGNGDSQALNLVTERVTSGSYAVRASQAGDYVTNDGRYYECISAHTSSASDEPGTGANWRIYWRLAEATSDSGGISAWATSTGYTARAVYFAITATGRIHTNQDTGTATIGAQVDRIPIYNEAGTLLGYIPIYAAS